MKKKTILIFIIFLFFDSTLGFANDSSSWSDVTQMDNQIQYNNAQKQYSNRDYEKVIETLQKNKDKKNKKKDKKKIILLPKNINSSEMQFINDTVNEVNTVRFFVKTFIPNTFQEIPIGFYKVTAFKDEKDNSYYLNLFQGHFLIAKIKAYETKEDFGADSVNFAKIIPYNEKFMKLIYGSLKVNLETLLILD